MAYDFFFSYTRNNDSGYLQQFYNDLSNEVRQQTGTKLGQQVGYIDQRDIELGENWEEGLITGLQESKVMISIYSPGYFKSEYCGKEWQVFNLRREEYRKRNPGASLPPVIIPIFWQKPLPIDLSPEIKALQYTFGDPAADHNQNGVVTLLKQWKNYEDIYKNYIDDLATKILRIAATYELPALTTLPLLKDLKSAFTPDAAPQVKNSNISVRTPKKVRFVYVAGNPNEFNGSRSGDAYLENGGADWRPFYPNKKKIGTYVQNIVSSEELDFLSDELPLTNNLLKEIEQAYDERNIVIILVDGWTINWKVDMQTILEDFDKNAKTSLINCSVFIIKNNEDSVATQQHAEIETTIERTFRNRNYLNSFFYKSSINSMDELRKTLSDVLIQIKSEMHKRAEIERPMSSSISKPIVNNLI